MPEAVTAEAPPPPPTARARRAVPVWAQVTALLVVLAAALLVGSGAVDSAPPTDAQRAAAIEATVRCPSCQDVSVAQSQESTAIAVRHQIVRMVAQGDSAQQIDDALVASYGPTILLAPPDHGLTALVWMVPVVLGLVAVVAMGVLFWRRSRVFEQLKRDGS